MKYLFTILPLLILLSCKTDPPTPPKPAVKKEPAPKVAPRNVDKELWEKFWADFKTAVSESNAEKIADMSVFPLKGMEPLVQGKTMTRERFIKNFDKIYDEHTKDSFINAKSNFTEFAVRKEKTAKRLNLPMKTKIYSLKVDYKTDENPNPDKKSITYHFAKQNGVYKVYSVLIGN